MVGASGLPGRPHLMGCIHRGGPELKESDTMADRITKNADEVKLIVFACEAGMGSSLMGANQLKKMVKKAKLDITVIHAPVSQMPENVDVVVTHKGLAGQAKTNRPGAAIIPFTMFFNDPAVKGVVATLKAGQPVVSEL